MNTCQLTKMKAPTTPTKSLAPIRSGLLQRKCACGGTPGPTGECEACRKKRLLRLGNLPASSTINHQPSTISQVPPIVHEVLRLSGQPLDPATRAFMESRFDADFSQVRIHTDKKSAESAWAVNALAYTAGRDIVFGAGLYSPGTSDGRRLLSHELAHVVQQSSPRGRSSARKSISSSIGSANGESEREADYVSEAVMSMGGPSTIALNLEATHDPRTQRVSEAVVSRGSISHRILLPNSSGFGIARAWDWRKAGCHAACWAAGGAITAIVALACAAGSVVTIGGLAIPCTYAIVATAALAGAGSSLCADLCDHALAPAEPPAAAPPGGAGGAPAGPVPGGAGGAPRG
jgi:hypothetical protein